ncbi:alpha-ribazole phosphatase [Listeria ivanovii]|uniref:Alpha-ribazole phosphatase n=1 Tax=Listeria ivanovii (strain ATCC BAA-678 / PAM 55) TaxID=881621 RepID=G2ZEQ3_LISIP|nr:alpha-ribazole phosphatase [Listeria ivanovii]AHI55628.1 alpha-ribazole phosphatase [Listeria ivanovii WSLC3009]AIS65080.1 alpha-ribazole phosphatase [Listeria ivanovii subsp. ivanovii]MBC1758195.1 alpha-ribazole phosphatase [Listeria ivanovii]MCJ1716130.1 alpha-ribazole phosphatase [Listeria ivanovii]MCJ1721958.1 alpha-ribazole phosphatase [Listeria ivanovii]
MHLVLVRHGETDMNLEKRYGGQTDVPLNDIGKRQMQQLKEKLANYTFDLVVTSDLVRVKESAAILSGAKKVHFPELNELNFGDFEGYTYQEINELFPAAWKAYCDDWQTADFPNGENFSLFKERVMGKIAAEWDLWQKLDRVLIVGHLGVLRLISLFLQNQKIAQYWDTDFKQGYYSLWDNESASFLISNK